MLQIDNFWLLVALIPIVSFLYSAVGHGGASGYLALMVLFNLSPNILKPTALLLNLFVAGISFIYFVKAGFFNFKVFLALSVFSIPMAFLGGSIELNAQLYKKVLGVFLIFVVLKMLFDFNISNNHERQIKLWQSFLVGGGIGFLSGLIGIGGGVILTPILILNKWSTVKVAAGVSALFIWVNSLSGLLGQISSGVSFSEKTYLLVLAAIVGGFAGSYFGSNKFNIQVIRYILTIVLALAGFKLFIS